MNNLDCGRQEDLVSFLYGELSGEERLSFERHMNQCAECKAQTSQLGDIRGAVLSWRDETLGQLTPATSYAPVVEPRRSAVAAIREFFNLSPLWMKGAVAFASLAFCALAVFAIVRFGSTDEQVVQKSPDKPTISAEEINAQVERRVQDELKRREAAQQPVDNMLTQAPPRVSPRPVNRRQNASLVATERNTSRPLTKLERQELAADLRLTAEDDDLDLLLLGDRINQ